MAPTLAQDILAERLSVDPRMVDLFERVRTSLAAESDGAARFSFEFPELRQLPAPEGWLEWHDGIALGVWWLCRDEKKVDVYCFHRTADGQAAMVCAIHGYRFGSTALGITFSDRLKDSANASAVAADYLNILAVASALLAKR